MLAQTLDDITLADLVSDATAAPSMHNAQPWHFDYKRSSRTLALRADFDRAMPEADPSTRALHVGCGAALLNLRVSAAHQGLSMETTLLPVPSDQALLASNHLSDSPNSPGMPRSSGSTAPSGTGTPAGTHSTRGRYPRTSVCSSPTRPAPKERTSRS